MSVIMDETSIKHWIGQLDKHRDDLVIALHYYEIEEKLIPRDENKLATRTEEVQQTLNKLDFDVRRLLKEAGSW